MLTNTNLVHDGNASILALLVELHHGGGDVAGSDDVLLLANGRLDDGSMVNVRDQADDEVVLRDLGVQGLVIVDVQRDGRGALDAGGQRLGGFEGPASYRGGKKCQR